VAEAVCSYFNCKMALIKSEKRDRPIAFPRQVLMYLLRVELRLSLSEIGEILGGRDHTTIIHGVDKITELLPMSDRLRDDIANIKQKVF